MEKFIGDFLLFKKGGKVGMLRDSDFYLKRELGNLPLGLKIKNAKNKLEKQINIVMFYFNETPSQIMNDWESVSNEDFGTDIYFKAVNLDLEKQVFKLLRNIPYSNPFRWMKITNNDRRSFIVFYFDRYPQFFYTGELKKNKLEKVLKVDNDDILRGLKQEKIKTFGNKIFGIEDDYRSTGNNYIIGETEDSQKKQIFKLNKDDLFRVNVMEEYPNYNLTFTHIGTSLKFISYGISPFYFTNFLRKVSDKKIEVEGEVFIETNESLKQTEEWKDYYNLVEASRLAEIDKEKDKIEVLGLSLGVSGVNKSQDISDYLNEINSKII